MSTVKVIELIGTSADSWEDATQSVVKKASETIHSITGVELIAQTATVENGAIHEYHATVHVAFKLDESSSK